MALQPNFGFFKSKVVLKILKLNIVPNEKKMYQRSMDIGALPDDGIQVWQLKKYTNVSSCHHINVETGALSDSKMTWKTTRSKVPHICITYIPESQLSIHFALRSTYGFRDRDNFGKVHWMTSMTSKWHWNVKGRSTPDTCMIAPVAQTFPPFHFTISRLEDIGNFSFFSVWVQC